MRGPGEAEGGLATGRWARASQSITSVAGIGGARMKVWDQGNGSIMNREDPRRTRLSIRDKLGLGGRRTYAAGG